MTLDEFVNKYLGKKVDYDGFYQGQCVDLYRFYLKEVLNTTQTPPVVGASEIFDTAGDRFERIVNTPDGVPQKGDIVIWNKKAGGGFGHVAVFIEGDANRFKSFDQNWRALNVCEPTEHTYTNVRGWLRFITMPEKTYTEAEMTKVRLERDENWNKYQSEKADHEATKGELLEVRTSHNQFLQSLATKLVCLADEANIIGTIDRLLEVEDQLTKARKDYSQLEKEKFLLESDKNREIERLQDELSDMRKENISFQSKLATQFIEIEKLSNRIEELLGLPQEKTISPPFNGLSGLINSIKSVLRRILWLK